MDVRYPDVRLFGTDGKRKYFPAHMVDSVDWELIANGYYGNCTITMADTFDAGASVAGNDRVDIYVDGTLRYRGFVGNPEQSLDMLEKKSISVFGLAERLNSISANKRYLYPAGVDVSVVFSKIVTDFVSSRISGLETDIQTVGFDVTEIDAAQTVRGMFDALMRQAASRAVWGFDVNPATGASRIFIRPKGTDVKYKHQIGGDVKQYSYPRDYTQIVNKVHLTGAESKYPNLVFNGGFEQIKRADATDGNILLDPGFETGTPWTSGNSASRINSLMRAGTYCYRLGSLNSWVQQTGIAITAGKKYTVEAWHYNPNAAALVATITPNAGSVIYLPDAYGEVLTGGGTNPPYKVFRYEFTAPIGATSCTLRFTNNWGDSTNFCIDDVAMYESYGVAQEGWVLEADPDVTGTMQWDSESNLRLGYYTVKSQASIPNGKKLRIMQKIEKAMDVVEGRVYQLSAWMRNNRVSGYNSNKFAVQLGKNDGTWTWVTVEGAGITAEPGAWGRGYLTEYGWTIPAGYTKMRVGLELYNDTGSTISTDISLDGFYCHEWGSAPAGAAVPDFVTEKTLEFDLSTADSFVQSDSALPAAVKNSIANYGIREASESVDTISSLEQAQNWAIGYFGLKAQPVSAHRVDIANWQGEIKPDGLFKLLGSTIEAAFPAKIRYQLGGDNMLNVSIDLNTERPTFEGLLQNVLNAARAAVK